MATHLSIPDEIVRESGVVGTLVIARDLAANPPTLALHEDLLSAVHKMVASKYDQLVVIDEENREKVIGILSRTDLVAAYDRQFLSGHRS
ncbi:MAG: CBS domain-containing protein [Candidatus Lindowbacteria bacterium]|nr:CBS domain-containing protein [Candidatus Lindowbacteria bacterium]